MIAHRRSASSASPHEGSACQPGRLLQLQGILLEDPTWIQWLKIAQVIRHTALLGGVAGSLQA
jgi:hypothetical protein